MAPGRPETIARAPAVPVWMARRVIKHRAGPTPSSARQDEIIYQTVVSRADDMAEFRAARTEDRTPDSTGS